MRSSVLYWVGGWWRPAAVRRPEDGVQMPVLTSRKSKRRFRVDSGVKRADTVTQERCLRKRERSRQREFVSAGEAVAPDTVTQERCRVKSGGEPEGAISRPEVRSGR